MPLIDSDTIPRLRMLFRAVGDSFLGDSVLLGILARLRVRYGRPKKSYPDITIVTKSKLYLEYVGTTAVEMGPPTQIEFHTAKIRMIWKVSVPQDGELRKYIIWTELLGFREFDWVSSPDVHMADTLTVNYDFNCTPN